MNTYFAQKIVRDSFTAQHKIEANTRNTNTLPPKQMRLRKDIELNGIMYSMPPERKTPKNTKQQPKATKKIILSLGNPFYSVFV